MVIALYGCSARHERSLCSYTLMKLRLAGLVTRSLFDEVTAGIVMSELTADKVVINTKIDIQPLTSSSAGVEGIITRGTTKCKTAVSHCQYFNPRLRSTEYLNFYELQHSHSLPNRARYSPVRC